MTFSRVFTTAQVNAPLIVGSPTKRMALTRIAVYCSNATTVNVGASVKFSSALEPFCGHPGIAPGSGFNEIGHRQTPIAEGALGDSLLFSCDVPTTGSIRVSGTVDEYTFSNL
jgi:hypothetical protein